ncbi:putative cytochrome c oxidase assembly protein [Vibrio ichthyoenteri ATCC 700023]|uniref:Putative cytochrome c oxidase assembly protein n=1 Tax=Vibrio ichthyoenteri ATCC 700023 TaxID=870968 RepID=F9S6D0_9VIBR|nr:COX15/CtaA family protein [Vibrio ichthyoenteri]EGU33756.1 putative cytochrome c oxidase assembly protein [Vibrio ichthyoenteri ATCC 700023]
MVLKRMLQLSLVLTFAVILLGAYTRLADAGLGCPDWPGCYGQLSVPSSEIELAQANSLFPTETVEADKAWLEMIHRYFAGSLGLLVFAISVVALVQNRVGRLLPILVTLVVVFQALLGMWTVTMKLMPLVVMGHLLGGFTLFCLLALLYWRVSEKQRLLPQQGIHTSLKLTAISGLVLLVLQIALGGWTSSNYAALMCTELPICQGQWRDYLDFDTAFQLIQKPQDSYEFGTLDYGARMTIHIVHRFGAMIVTAALLALIWQLFKQPHYRYQQQAGSLALLLSLQVVLGISNVVFSLPIAVAVAHNLGAALLLLNVLYINHLLWHSDQKLLSARPRFGKEA